jgi:hypothetical protein
MELNIDGVAVQISIVSHAIHRIASLAIAIISSTINMGTAH